MELYVNIDSVEQEEGDSNHLLFNVAISSLNNNRLYQLDYTGTDLRTEASISDDWMKKIFKALRKDYGPGKFDIEKAKEKVEKKCCYVVKV